jgi:hypothetical protein
MREYHKDGIRTTLRYLLGKSTPTGENRCQFFFPSARISGQNELTPIFLTPIFPCTYK